MPLDHLLPRDYDAAAHHAAMWSNERPPPPKRKPRDASKKPRGENLQEPPPPSPRTAARITRQLRAADTPTDMPTVIIFGFNDIDEKKDSLHAQLAAVGVKHCDVVMEKFIFEWGLPGKRKKGDGDSPGWGVFGWICARADCGGRANFPVIITYNLRHKVRKDKWTEEEKVEWGPATEDQRNTRVSIRTSGQVQEGAYNCVVSFPGDHAFEWNNVLLAKGSTLKSSACVFLAENVGPLHSRNPDQPSGCMCSFLYGSNPKVAKQLDKQGRAPWGCMWFDKWCKNVQKAVDNDQELWCFYTLMDKSNFVHEIEINPAARFQFSEYFKEEERLVRSGKVRRYIGNSQQAEVRWIREKYGKECRMWPIALIGKGSTASHTFIDAFSPSTAFHVDWMWEDELHQAYFRRGPRWVESYHWCGAQHANHNPATTNW